jgi:hypothetical protein
MCAEYDYRVSQWLAIADRVIAETQIAWTTENAIQIRVLMAAEAWINSDP